MAYIFSHEISPREGRHTYYKIENHSVWVTKYRHHVLKGDLVLGVIELVQQTCERFEIRIIGGIVDKYNVHI